MLPVPTVCAISNGEASKTATANFATKRPAKLQFKIVNLPFGLFTEPLLKFPFQKLASWIGNRGSMGRETAHLNSVRATRTQKQLPANPS
jgi:hypothetical protein